MKDFYEYSTGPYHRLYQTPTLWSTYQNYNYILAKGSEAWIFDPGELEPIEKTIRKNQLQPKQIFLTHHHHDHIAAAEALQELFQCPILGFEKDKHRLPSIDSSYNEDDTFPVLGCQAHVLFLPGHTLGLCALHIPELQLLFSNDLIFSLGCGRVFEGSFEQMWESLKQVRDLDENTLIVSSHEYTLGNLEFARTQLPDDEHIQKIEASLREKINQNIPTVPTPLSFEKKHNPFLRWDDPSLRAQLDLQEAPDWQVFATLRQLKDQF